ncbi:LUD domain-containing protein [Natronosalvus vescus]|uniref:LUD domain-containing protein n=1 Tax=Natronosalvus vescus TaxID=2953881 RepID=UPI0020900754|nr:LUD domain-containing protein [Natronosalvus vescus]
MHSEHRPPLERFTAALDDLECGVTRTTRSELPAVLESVVDPPAVGVPLESVAADVSIPSWIDTDPTPATLEAATTGVTPAVLGIADYGSVLIPERPAGAEPVSLFPDTHVAVLEASAIVPDVRTAVDRLAPRLRRGESAILATGPSATADMGALVRGAHGPKHVHVIVLEDADTGDTGVENSNAGDIEEVHT